MHADTNSSFIIDCVIIYTVEFIPISAEVETALLWETRVGTISVYNMASKVSSCCFRVRVDPASSATQKDEVAISFATTRRSLVATPRRLSRLRLVDTPLST